VRWLAALLLVAACGSSKPESGGAIGNAAPDAGRWTLTTPAAGCPETYGEAAGGCDQRTATNSCLYPEGHCYCGQAPVCSGVEPDPADLARRPIEWQCTPTPPDVRADGCPGVPDATCATEGQECSYGDCCFVAYRCVGGVWQEIGGGCPP
jgi:hypothetical protein